MSAAGLSDADARKNLRAAREAAYEQFRSAGTVGRLHETLTRLSDQAIRRLWDKASLSEDACLVAVGGYGRGELLPGSDIDLLILVPDEVSDTLNARVESFIGSCWDLGLEIGQSVRSVEQCLQESTADVTVQTSLLERRFLCGQQGLHHDLVNALSGHFDARAFFSCQGFRDAPKTCALRRLTLQP